MRYLSKILVVICITLVAGCTESNKYDLNNPHFVNSELNSVNEINISSSIEKIVDYYESTYRLPYDSAMDIPWFQEQDSYIEPNYSEEIHREDILNYDLSVHLPIFVVQSEIDPVNIGLYNLLRAIENCVDFFESELCQDEYTFYVEGDNVYIKQEKTHEVNEYIFFLREKLEFHFHHTVYNDDGILEEYQISFREDEYYELIVYSTNCDNTENSCILMYSFHDFEVNEFVKFTPTSNEAAIIIYLPEKEEVITNYGFMGVLSYSKQNDDKTLVSFNSRQNELRLYLNEFDNWNRLVEVPNQEKYSNVDVEYSLYFDENLLLEGNVYLNQFGVVYYDLKTYTDTFNFIDEDLITLSSININSPFDYDFINEKLEYSENELHRVMDKYDMSHSKEDFFLNIQYKLLFSD